MTLTLRLPRALQRELATEAGRLGLSLDEYALRLLVGRGSDPPSPRTGAELVAFWEAEGVTGSRDAVDDAPRHARALREAVERRGQE